MIGRAVSWATRVRACSAARKGVLLILAAEAGETNLVQLPTGQIAELAEISPRHANRILKDLVSAGLISIDRAARDPWRRGQAFRLAIPAAPAAAAPADDVSWWTT